VYSRGDTWTKTPDGYRNCRCLMRTICCTPTTWISIAVAVWTAPVTARSAVSDPSEGNRYRHTCSWFETNEFECLVAVCMPTGVGSSVSFELPRLQSSRTLMPSAAASAGSANCWRWRICSLFPDCVTRHHLLKMRPLRALCREKRKDLINRGSKL